MSKAISVSCSCHHSEILRLSRCRTGVDGVPELVCGSNWICPKLPRSPIVHRTMCHQNPTHWLKRFTLFFDKANYHLTIILYPPDIPIVFRVPILSIHQWPSWRSPPTPGTSAEPRFFFSVDKFLLEYWNHHSFHQPPKKMSGQNFESEDMYLLIISGPIFTVKKMMISYDPQGWKESIPSGCDLTQKKTPPSPRKKILKT